MQIHAVRRSSFSYTHHVNLLTEREVDVLILRHIETKVSRKKETKGLKVQVRVVLSSVCMYIWKELK